MRGWELGTWFSFKFVPKIAHQCRMLCWRFYGSNDHIAVVVMVDIAFIAFCDTFLLKVRQGQRSCHWHWPRHHQLLCLGNGGEDAAGAGEQWRGTDNAIGRCFHVGQWENCRRSSAASGCHQLTEYTVRHQATDRPTIRWPRNQEGLVSFTRAYLWQKTERLLFQVFAVSSTVIYKSVGDRWPWC